MRADGGDGVVSILAHTQKDSRVFLQDGTIGFRVDIRTDGEWVMSPKAEGRGVSKSRRFRICLERPTHSLAWDAFSPDFVRLP